MNHFFGRWIRLAMSFRLTFARVVWVSRSDRVRLKAWFRIACLSNMSGLGGHLAAVRPDFGHLEGSLSSFPP